MEQRIIYVGLDVHKDTIAVAFAEAGKRGELREYGTGLACVIDRPGYNARYLEKYGRQRWSLCKSAFTIAVERAAKYARSIDCRLRVCHERCNKTEDGMLKGYYEELKRDGPPFDTSRSEKYRPLTGAEFRETLYELQTENENVAHGSICRSLPVADVHGRLQSSVQALQEAD